MRLKVACQKSAAALQAQQQNEKAPYEEWKGKIQNFYRLKKRLARLDIDGLAW